MYSLTSGVIGTSDEYRDRPFLNQKRDVLKETVYVGNEISVFDREAEQHADEVQKEEGTFWVTYAGTIGTSYDIRTMVLAAEELMKAREKRRSGFRYWETVRRERCWKIWQKSARSKM